MLGDSLRTNRAVPALGDSPGGDIHVLSHGNSAGNEGGIIHNLPHKPESQDELRAPCHSGGLGMQGDVRALSRGDNVGNERHPWDYPRRSPRANLWPDQSDGVRHVGTPVMASSGCALHMGLAWRSWGHRGVWGHP